MISTVSYSCENTNPLDWKPTLSQHYHINAIYTSVLGATSQHTDGFLESNSNYDVIQSVVVTTSDALPLYYVTWVNEIKYV